MGKIAAFKYMNLFMRNHNFGNLWNTMYSGTLHGLILYKQSTELAARSLDIKMGLSMLDTLLLKTPQSAWVLKVSSAKIISLFLLYLSFLCDVFEW